LEIRFVRRLFTSLSLFLGLVFGLAFSPAAFGDPEPLPMPREVGAKKADPPKKEQVKEEAPKDDMNKEKEVARTDDPKEGKKEGAKADDPKGEANKDGEKKEEPKPAWEKPLGEVKTSAENANQKGDSAWVLTASAFVMFMLPGLALFYGGMVRRKNVLATMMQSFAASSSLP
jgi:ammonium transporter, Amt family